MIVLQSKKVFFFLFDQFAASILLFCCVHKQQTDSFTYFWPDAECPKLNKFVNLNVTVTQLAKTAAFQAILLLEVWAKYSATTCFFQHEKLIIKWQVTGEFFLNIQVFRPEFHSERLPILYYECIKTNKKWVAFWYPN